MKFILYVITGLLIFLGSTALAQEPFQINMHYLSPQWSKPVGDISPIENLTLKELPTVARHGRGGAQMCTIIPWFCDPD